MKAAQPFKSATLVLALAGTMLTGAAHAIVITPETDAHALASTLTDDSEGFVVLGATLTGHTLSNAASTGTFTNASGTYGIGPGIVMSSGNVLHYGDGPNSIDNATTDYQAAATAAQEDLLDPITGGSYDHYDVTQLDIRFTTSTGSVFFDVVFGSEEFKEYVGSEFIDGFGLYLDGVNIAFVEGNPVNINHPGMLDLPGTELDGVLTRDGNPLLRFSAEELDVESEHLLTFILADTSDQVLDSTVFISSLSGTAPVPVPAAVWLFGSALAGVFALVRPRGNRKG